MLLKVVTGSWQKQHTLEVYDVRASTLVRVTTGKQDTTSATPWGHTGEGISQGRVFSAEQQCCHLSQHQVTR